MTGDFRAGGGLLFDGEADGDGDGDRGLADFDRGGCIGGRAAGGQTKGNRAAGGGLRDGEDVADADAGGSGEGLGAPAGISDSVLAGGFEEVVLLAEAELEAVEPGGIAGGGEGVVDDPAEAVEVAHADGEDVLDGVPGDDGGARPGVVVLGLDGDGAGLDVAVGDAVGFDGSDEAGRSLGGAFAGVGDGGCGDFDAEVEGRHIGRGGGFAGAGDGDAEVRGRFS
ncbi:hypothetical protein Tbon_03520 [Tepidiforma bonchosmolovskayae]|uniref:Uncharacterized protein n=1 Tax=Tepidiforma bonchosmolovskayae TaxID=2601677 RepID=A0ABX6BZL5_9CHLR|nr:hypothetical protein Tbon_03520 [Tepidiforma bonchosmolovskayae]